MSQDGFKKDPCPVCGDNASIRWCTHEGCPKYAWPKQGSLFSSTPQMGYVETTEPAPSPE